MPGGGPGLDEDKQTEDQSWQDGGAVGYASPVLRDDVSSEPEGDEIHYEGPSPQFWGSPVQFSWLSEWQWWLGEPAGYLAGISAAALFGSLAIMTQVLATSRLDYSNILCMELPCKWSGILQLVTNVARLLVGIAQKRHIYCITDVLQGLHWCPITFQAQFKVLALTFKAQTGLLPEDQKDHLQHIPAQSLLQRPSSFDGHRGDFPRTPTSLHLCWHSANLWRWSNGKSLFKSCLLSAVLSYCAWSCPFICPLFLLLIRSYQLYPLQNYILYIIVFRWIAFLFFVNDMNIIPET